MGGGRLCGCVFTLVQDVPPARSAAFHHPALAFLLHSLPQADKERPWRRYDQDKETIATYRRLPIVESAAAQGEEGSPTYRLDIELGRLEFLMHPGMAREDLLVGGAAGVPDAPRRTC